MTDVFYNNNFIGRVDNAIDFVNKVREERRKGKIPNSLNIMNNVRYNEVHIEVSRGRVRRPLIVVEEGKSKLNREHIEQLRKDDIGWNYLIDNGIIEYLDAAEEENTYIALYEKDLTKDHTHLEINPILIFGLCSSLVPYANYGQSSRLNRGQKTQKQSIGLYAANYLLRVDTDVSLLHYPQTPIVNSFIQRISKQDKHPAGQNITIALMSKEGYNMQDAIIINKGSVDRGLFRSTYFRPYSADELRYSGGLTDEIGVPDKEVKGYKSEHDYRFLEDDGIISTESKVNDGDVIIGKTSPPRFLGDLDGFSLSANIRRESSVIVKNDERGVVDMLFLTENEEGNKLVQARLRDERIPEVGDKFASRHGQKGVIGLVMEECDIPFTSSGVKPDIIFSPHSIPSRMTIGHLIEIIAGKVGALNGRFVDGTTFDVENEKDLRRELLSLGFRENGSEKMYDGVTGNELESTIFIGNMYYLRLKHMVANKLHARASGRIQLLTRQPIEGRSKGGGLRLGEMEKDCFVAHGASLLLKERFDSDKILLYICESCGMVAINDEYRSQRSCPKCGGNVEINAIELSYAFKLLLDELKSLLINPKLILKDKY